MSRTVYAQQGDTLDSLIYRTVGVRTGLLESVLALNPHLAKITILPLGTAVKLPDIREPSNNAIKSTVQLWE